jgi:UDP-N-acetylglucosamine/UDP-N-acetylgalactosamine diphosphorylase
MLAPLLTPFFIAAFCFVFISVSRSLRYSEISVENATAVDALGQLRFNAGNICNHVYSTSCLQAFSTAVIPYHVAHKKIPAADELGCCVAPCANNGIKLER